jgi:DNA-binding PadR family transcriptional regulator
MTATTKMVLRELLSAHQENHKLYGLEICDLTGLGHGTVYPILDRLAEEGFAQNQKEDKKDRVGQGRPLRIYYWLTEKGVKKANSIRY